MKFFLGFSATGAGCGAVVVIVVVAFIFGLHLVDPEIPTLSWSESLGFLICMSDLGFVGAALVFLVAET